MYAGTLSSKPTPAERFAANSYPKGSLLLLGKTRTRAGQERFFGLLPEDRLRHIWIIGKTGVGKSTLLAGLLAQDLVYGRGAAVFDPHGSLVEATLAQVPPSRHDDVVLIRPADKAHPIGFNIFRQGGMPHSSRSLLTSMLISTFKAQWPNFWGPRLEHVLRRAVLAVAEHPEATLPLLYAFLVDEKRHQEVLAHLTDEAVIAFWTKEWPSYSKALKAEALSPVLNKLGAFTGNPIIRGMVEQPESCLDLAEVLRSGKLLFVDLAVGKLGEDTSHLLGGLILSSLSLAAMSRPLSSSPYFVYADEFQRVVNAQLPMLLAESRKFGLAFILAHQYIEQLPKELTAALLGNVGTTLMFRVGPRDAEVLAPVVHPDLAAHHLTNLNTFRMAVRQLAHGKTLSAFVTNTLPPLREPTDREEKVTAIVAASRARYSTPPSAAAPPASVDDAPPPPPTVDRFSWS